MTEKYKPEGYIIDTPENAEHISTLASLEYAMSAGITLEARVLLCDSKHNLLVELGSYHGIIPRSEAAYSTDGSEIRDIAVITRVGKPVCFKVTSIDKSGKEPQIILSRRAAQAECFEKHISYLESGDVIDAKITHIEPFGCFCDIGCGIVSLLPVDCQKARGVHSLLKYPITDHGLKISVLPKRYPSYHSQISSYFSGAL